MPAQEVTLATATAAALVFLLPVVFVPSVAAGFWAPKFALLLLLSGISLPLLAKPYPPALRSARRAAVAFVAVAGLSTLLARNPSLSIVGEWNWGTGLLFVMGLAGAWALGTALGCGGRVWIERALLAAAAANVLVTLLAAYVVNPAFAPLTRIDGRPVGLLGNPVHTGSLVLAALVVLIPRLSARPLLWAPALFLCGSAVELAGGRFAAVGAVAVLLLSARWFSWRVVAAAAALVTSGFLMTALLAAPAVESRSEIVTLSSRSADSVAERGAGSLAPRKHNWSAGVEAALRRPVLGHGPGRFRAAAAPHLDDSLRDADAREFVDAHNIVVEYGVTIGSLGVLALVAFMWAAVRRGSGALLASSVVLMVAHLIQPQTPGLTPLLFLMLGASASQGHQPPPPRAREKFAVALGGLAGTAAALALLAGAFHLDQARLDFDVADGLAADRLLRVWPEPALRLATIYQFRGLTGDAAAHATARAWLVEAIRRDPSEARNWLRLAEYAESRGELDRAVAAYTEALERNPSIARAHDRLRRLRSLGEDAP